MERSGASLVVAEGKGRWALAKLWLVLARCTAAWQGGSAYEQQLSLIFRLITHMEQGRRLCIVSSWVESIAWCVSHHESAENIPFLGEVENASFVHLS